MKLKADTINGVTQVDCEIDPSAVNVLDAEDFYSSLRTLEDGEEIYCESSDTEIINKIEKEYGIH